MFPCLSRCPTYQLAVPCSLLLPDHTLAELRARLAALLGEDQTDSGTEEPGLSGELGGGAGARLNSDPVKPRGSRSAKKSYTGELYPGPYPYKCSFCEKRFKQVKQTNFPLFRKVFFKYQILLFCQSPSPLIIIHF